MANPKDSPETLMQWLKSALMVWDRGGAKLFADELGVKPSNFSHLTHRGRFCDKTIRAMAAVDKLRSENFDDDLYPVIGTTEINGIVWEERQFGVGTTVHTWKSAE